MPEHPVSPAAAVAAPGPGPAPMDAPRLWGQPPHVQEPIIDAARIPLSAYGPRWSPARKLRTCLWLRVLRPLFTGAVWAVAGYHAWRYLRDASAQPSTQQLLLLYALIIGGICVLMLVAAPLRRLQWRQPPVLQADGSSLMALAAYVELPPTQLSQYRQARLLLVHHNRQGRLREAQDTTPGDLRDDPLLRAAA